MLGTLSADTTLIATLTVPFNTTPTATNTSPLSFFSSPPQYLNKPEVQRALRAVGPNEGGGEGALHCEMYMH